MSISVDIIPLAGSSPAAGVTVVTGSLCEDYEYTATASVHSILPAIDHMMSQLAVAVRTLNTVCQFCEDSECGASVRSILPAN